MDKRFQNIKVLIWDFDGTFFIPNQKLWDVVRQGEYRTIMNHTGWTMEKTVKEKPENISLNKETIKIKLKQSQKV